MATDVRLDQYDGTYLVLSGRVVKAETTDFMLDATGRRKRDGGFRRALVHDQNDGLTVNFAGDYPGGVSILGVAEIVPRLQDGERQSAVPTLVVRGGISYEAPSLSLSGGPGGTKAASVTVHLDEELTKLEAQVASLAARISTLEAGK